MPMVTAKSNEAALAQRFGHGFATRPRLTVLAGHSSDTVAHAGGLIFDRVGAGWDVRVYLAAEEPGEIRALQILGVQKRIASIDFDPSEWPDFVLIGSDVFSQDAKARRVFTAAARRPHTEVAMWGDQWPAKLAPGIGRVEHRLSTAARAFKAHALGAAGLAPTAGDAEQFHCGQHRFDVAAPLLPPA